MTGNEPTHTQRRDFKTYLPWITTPALCVLLVAVWWLYIDVSKISAFILPTPVSVWHAWIGLLVSRRAWIDTAMTVYATLLGFLWAMIIGVGLGVLIARVRWLEQTLNPFIVASQVLPKVALVPLFVVWFGFGVTSKVLIAATLAFFPILTNTVLGVKVDRPRLRRRDDELERHPLAGFSPARIPLLAAVHHHRDGSRHRAGADRRDRR